MRHWASLVAALTFAIPASGGEGMDESLPFFGHIANAKGNSALSMDCDGDPLATIYCHFTQVTVSIKDGQR